MARIAGINIPQNKVVSVALTYIHGIGLHSSKKICEKLDIPVTKRVNDLTEEQVLKIREFIDANHKVEGDLRREVSGAKQLNNKKLCEVRAIFDKYNLISGLHTFCSQENEIYKNVLPPLSILNQSDQKNLIEALKNLNFTNKPPLAA